MMLLSTRVRTPVRTGSGIPALLVALALSGAVSQTSAQPFADMDCGDQTPAQIPDSRFVLFQDGTVRDDRTELMWKACAEGLANVGCVSGAPEAMSWQAAQQRAAASGFAGHADWRLPTRPELRSLLELRCYGLGIDGVIFPNSPPGAFWTSTPAAFYPGSAWTLDFAQGVWGYGTRRDQAYVRLVRDSPACTPARPGQCLPHEDRLYEPHGGVEELESDAEIEVEVEEPQLDLSQP